MGRKKRLNHYIRKWIKSDLPDDRTTVLLLGVTRIPTTPTVARRPCSLPLNSQPLLPNIPVVHPKLRKPSLSSCKSYLKDSKSNKRVIFDSNEYDATASASTNSSTSTSSKQRNASDSDDTNPSNLTSLESGPCPTMDRSVDSIGTCSLDADASVDISDWSEQSSVGTLRSASFSTPEPLPHLPSYLNLACTVSGYSTTTNYDPERLARSRDASPHRLQDDSGHLTPQNKGTPVYCIRNNLLSPPNVVPLPNHRYTLNITPETPKNMENQVITRHEYYSSSSTKTTTFMSKESKNFVNGMFSTDSVDGCLGNGHQRCVTFESKSYITNGKSISEAASYKEFSNGIEKKSFIQQRVERLYGPGALAHGFFVSRRQKDRLSESDSQYNCTNGENNKHSKSMTDNLLQSEAIGSNLRQTISNPVLPVLRHLRPEFRAQLPIISPKKVLNTNSKSDISLVKEETANNGCCETIKNIAVEINGDQQNVINNGESADDTGVKDGHYFLEIIEKQTQRLLKLAERVEKEELELSELSEEVKGKLRAASGKARLLSSQKIQQFKGLCTKNITQSDSEDYPTTNEDLQGFWDMVLLQVDQVDAIFKEIDILRQNGWIDPSPVRPSDIPTISNRNVSKPRKTKTTAANEEIRKIKEAQRKKMIEEKRKAMRENNFKPSDNIEIFMAEAS